MNLTFHRRYKRIIHLFIKYKNNKIQYLTLVEHRDLHLSDQLHM